MAWSLDAFGDWTAAQYEVAKVTVEEDDIQEEELIAWHLPNAGLSKEHQPFLDNQLSAAEQAILSACHSGQDLLDNWTKWFTQLDLTSIAQKTLPQLPTAAVPAVTRILLELQAFFSRWDGAPANYETALRYKATQESDSRIKAYAAQLHIKCPDGETRLMNWHFRYTIGAGRLYFMPDEDKCRCFIGYVGIKIGAT